MEQPLSKRRKPTADRTASTPEPSPPPTRETVQTAADLAQWLYLELLARELVMLEDSNWAAQPSDLRTLRDAYSLVSNLGLTGMPEEPAGPAWSLTNEQEMVALRNLRMRCLALVPREEPAGEETTPSEPVGEETTPSDVVAADGQQQLSAETPEVPPALLAAADLARKLGQPVQRVETFLRRFRVTHPDCFEGVENHRRNEPRILYRTADVWPALQRKLTTWQQLPTDG
jgi:hypothetical protein